MATLNRNDTESMLMRALRYDDAPSPSLNNKLKQHVLDGFYDAPPARASYRPRLVTVLITVAMLMTLSTAVLAATGALGDIFAALTRGPAPYRSREALIDHGFVAEVTPDLVAVTPDDSGATLEMRAYYAGSREIGLDFTLTGIEIPEKFSHDPEGFRHSHVGIRAFALEMTDRGGAKSTWECSYDDENDIESRTFPGGKFFLDRKNDLYEYQSSGQDFMVEAYVVGIGDGAYDVSVIVSFWEGAVSLGENESVTIEDLTFLYIQNISDDVEVTERFTVDGTWTFEFDIDDRFSNAEPLSYAPVASGETQGITITNITVTPTVCEIDAVIDFSKNNLADPANADYAKQRVAAGDSPDMTYDKFLAKLNLLSVGVFAMTEAEYEYQTNRSESEERKELERQLKEYEKVAEEWLQGGKQGEEPLRPSIADRPAPGLYGEMGTSYDPDTGINGSILTCHIEIDSMYFDAPENLIVRFMGFDGTPIDIPIARSRRT